MTVFCSRSNAGVNRKRGGLIYSRQSGDELVVEYLRVSRPEPLVWKTNTS